jgi:hypothetical protein
MNRKLKAKMIEYYGGQWKFAQKINVHESYVSGVVRGTKKLSDDGRKKWAKLLHSDLKELFPDARN